jgi:hypothetical protein
MKALLCILGAIAITALPASAGQPNTLSKAEKDAGWKLLFNGKNLDGFRPYNPSGKIGEGWQVADGLLIKKAKTRGGDIMTEDTFDDFELSWEWTLAKNGNNGIKYMILEERKRTIGHEYQILDDFGHPDGKKGKDRQVAALYDVIPPAADKPRREPGEWNQSRIIVKGNHAEHWLNGAKVLEYECGSKELLAAVQESKFKKVEGFGKKVRGHILITDHADECKFRNLKIRSLD